jgi:hypothetical protein
MRAMIAAAARRARVVVAVVFVSTVSGGVSVGCGCTGIALAGLSVTVVDGATGASVCDATVTAQDGDHVETLNEFPAAGGGCTYAGAHERAGTYTLTATSGSRSKVVTDVRVSEEGSYACRHVATEKVTVTLDP